MMPLYTIVNEGMLNWMQWVIASAMHEAVGSDKFSN